MTENKIYLIMEWLEDSYEPAQPTEIAFINEIEAKSYIEERNNEEYSDYSYSYKEIKLK